MQERDLRVLEYPKILERLASMAMTEPGKAAARALRPSGDISEVRRLQQETEEALSAYAYHGGSPMAYFSDVSEYLQLAKVGSTLSMKALLTIAEGLRAARTVRSALVSDREDTRALSAIASELATNRSWRKRSSTPSSLRTRWPTAPAPELYDIRRRLRASTTACATGSTPSSAPRPCKSTCRTPSSPCATGATSSPCAPTAGSTCRVWCTTSPAAARRCSSSPAAVVEAGNEIKQWTLKERQEIDRILGEFTDRVAPDADLYRHNIEVLADLDMIFARAALAREMRAAPPKINEEGRVNLMRARHPLIDPEKVVPSTLWMGGESPRWSSPAPTPAARR